MRVSLYNRRLVPITPYGKVELSANAGAQGHPTRLLDNGRHDLLGDAQWPAVPFLSS